MTRESRLPEVGEGSQPGDSNKKALLEIEKIFQRHLESIGESGHRAEA